MSMIHVYGRVFHTCSFHTKGNQEHGERKHAFQQFQHLLHTTISLVQYLCAHEHANRYVSDLCQIRYHALVGSS